MSKRFSFLAVLLFFLLSPLSASAEERRVERGVPLMATGAALFTTSYAVSLAVGVHATADYVARCHGADDREPKTWSEAFECIGAPPTIHLMVPIAGPFRTLAETYNPDASETALLVADGIAQITGVVLAGIGMAQYIDGRSRPAEPAKSSLRVAPRGAGAVIVGTF